MTDKFPDPAGANSNPAAEERRPSASQQPEMGLSVRPAEAAGTQTLLFTPPIDIYETDEGLVLTADLPGVNLSGIELQVQNNKLTLLGHAKSPVPPQARLLYREYQEGDFLRSFILSEGVDHDHIVARLNHGVLEVMLPKAAKTTPRRIQVSTE